jgi:hypothetical protein
MIDGTVFSILVLYYYSCIICLKLEGKTTLSEVTIWPFRSREHSKDLNGRVSRDRDTERKDRVESEKVGEITTGIVIVIGITIGTVAMTVIVIEIMTAPEAMIQEGITLIPGSAGIAECPFFVHKEVSIFSCRTFMWDLV